jgi:hypothetical protein
MNAPALLRPTPYCTLPAALLALVLALGCDQGLAQEAPAQAQVPQTLDDRFADVARAVPEFGGMFLSPNEQKLRVYLTRVAPDRVAAVQKAIVDVFGPAAIPKGGIEPLRGQRKFLDLKDWYNRMQTPVWSTRGVIFTDIDEANNRLAIGVQANEIMAKLVEQLDRLKIPRDAVAIRVTEPFRPASHSVIMPNSMAAWPYPRAGGYILRRPLCNQAGVGLAGGTLGFNVTSGSGTMTLPGFVTNSHVTAAWWNLDTNIGLPAASFFQAAGYYPPHLVGVETNDPKGFTVSPCPTGQTCRYSDSALITYNVSAAPGLGVIGRTTAITTSVTNPILTINHSGNHPGEFWIVAPPQTPYLVGLTMNKVGQESGWTQGKIQATNVNIVPFAVAWVVKCWEGQLDPTFFPANAMYLSQYVVSHATNDLVAQDDSGSPVFRIQFSSHPKGQNNAELYGLLWGRSGTKTYAFSPIGGVSFQQAGIQTELGPLKYCVPGFSSAC